MKKTIIAIALLFLLLPAMAGAQLLTHEWLWEVGSTYKFNPDTCAILSDTTAADSAIFYINTGSLFSGYLPTFQIRFDSTGVGVLTWADSVTIKLYPRVPATFNEAKEDDESRLNTLWNDPITLSLPDGTQCSNWSPTAERIYFLGNADSWNGRQYYGVTLTVSVAATDACHITRLGVIQSYNR